MAQEWLTTSDALNAELPRTLHLWDILTASGEAPVGIHETKAWIRETCITGLAPLFRSLKTVVYDVRREDDETPMVLRIATAGHLPPKNGREDDNDWRSFMYSYTEKRAWSPFTLQPYCSLEIENGYRQLATFELLAKTAVRNASGYDNLISYSSLKYTPYREHGDRKEIMNLGHNTLFVDPDNFHFKDAESACDFWTLQHDPEWQQQTMAIIARNYDEAGTHPDARLVVPNGKGGWMTLQDQLYPNPFPHRSNGFEKRSIVYGPQPI